MATKAPISQLKHQPQKALADSRDRTHPSTHLPIHPLTYPKTLSPANEPQPTRPSY
ncbi:hypothetical protein N836_07045 [Leptolyngbya sp. Heron Island J]|nr:hypothetical protein N836_07045 [Leptolyngbya sp. Heron Island J]